VHIQNYADAIYAAIIDKANGTGSTEPPDASEALSALLTFVTFYKHCGFSEEHEVRIGVFPQRFSKDYLNLHVQHGTPLTKQERKIYYRSRNGLSIPYTKLFESLSGRTLPITRIIVGPQPDKERKLEGIRHLVRHRDIEVVMSDIPFAG
jgi:hypothetical protein